MTLRKASKYFKIPYSTLHDKINKTHEKKSGGQNALSDNLESYIVKTLDLLTTCKVPFDGYGVRCLVKSYLDNEKLNIKKFKNNFPRTEWVCSFIQRRKLSKCIDNVKSSRAEVNEDAINAYFDNLENEIKNIPPSNIFNYDETNITDDPGSKLVITRRGRNRVERKVYHSKSSISVMFAGSTDGTFLPPMVVYKSEDIYRERIRGGPVNTVYDCTKNG